MYGISICLLQGDENLALMTTTATDGTFSTNLSCVITLIHVVHLSQAAATFIVARNEQPFNMPRIAEIGLQSTEYD